MHLSHVVRQTHRWVSVVFTLAVVAVFVVMARPDPPLWVSYLPLLPLALLQLTGMYLFVLPYVARRRDGPSPT